ncbi:leucine-rich repeat and fibronectin type-III domain-containing protein 3-like isoform X1 [Macrobrachium nipponense]|uniref:leucine-rich repeat and fibronectin type-III domain-containing protein 3-like isoform X1 n=1 Tax=Macrobrachium nipponense TaxID=159736 RepID=UPI0030C89782
MTWILRSRRPKSHCGPQVSNTMASSSRTANSIYSRATQYLVFVLLGTTVVRAQCPWPREVTDLNASCLCAYNIQNELSIQCTSVNFTLLMTVLHQRANSVPLDLLYVNNTRISVLNDRTFDGLKVENIQFSSCDIYNISDNAFKGLENSLKNLNLQDNKLSSVPSGSISRLRRLVLLDLSGNQITSVPNEAFKGSRLATLKLADNDLSLAFGAFNGIERTLKNLNLKGTKLRAIPTAILNLPVLAFLDIAQNEIKELQPGSLKNLHSLTALNMERNSLQRLEANDFEGVNDTLSSLSLLNNHITEFPTEALNTLTELRVLDIGFNMITKIPDDAFYGVRSLTLLALDGNPINTVPVQAFKHLNTTLRGFSVGGKFLHCDCKVAWITEWIRDYDLQVTSRERNPQFCGQPPEYRDRSFFQLGPSEFVCDSEDHANPELPVSTLDPLIPPPPPPPQSTTTTTTTTSTEASTTTTTTPVIPTTRQTPSSPRPEVTSETPRTSSSGPGTIIQPQSAEESGVGSVGSVQRGPGGQGPTRNRPTLDVSPQIPPTRSQQRPSRIERPSSQPVLSPVKRPNLVVRQHDEPSGHSEDFFGLKSQGPYVEEVIVQDAYRKDNSVIIQWDSEVSNILGFRVVYRLFGDKTFKLGPPLASSEREFKIKNVPTQECVVVCVVSLEDVNVTPNNVQHSQCREIRTESSAAMHMDTIIIAASAAICGTVIIAVIVFICCNRKRSGHREKDGIPAVLSPASPPLASLGTLETGTLGGGYKGDGDNISMFSHRSIPRARMYHMDKGSVNNGFIPDDARSHISHISSKHIPRPRSMADGQSQRSYSALSAANLRYAPSFNHGLGLSRQDLSISRQSLAASQLSGADFSTGMAVNPNAFGHGMGGLSRMASQRSDRRRQRSKSRERASSRLSHAGSSHSLTGYDTDGWTDHDMDIYVARNPTRGGLVQL